MKKAAFFAGLLLLCPMAAAADRPGCEAGTCMRVYDLTSVSATKSYGLLIASPVEGCRKVRFRVETPSGGFLGHTPALGPGEMFMLRVGSGFSEGLTRLTIAAEGCASPPALVRRVTLAKRSPDHSARAARLEVQPGS